MDIWDSTLSDSTLSKADTVVQQRYAYLRYIDF